MEEGVHWKVGALKKKFTWWGEKSLEEETSETFVVFASETWGLRYTGLGYSALLNADFKNNSNPFTEEVSDGV